VTKRKPISGEQPLDYTLLTVTLTVAVETYLCDEHADLRHAAAIEHLLERLHDDESVLLLGSDFQPLTITKAVAR
jgi:hypothetical protein